MLALLTSCDFCIASRGKSSGLATSCRCSCSASSRVPTTISRAFTASPNCDSYAFLDLLVGHFQLVGRQLPQRERRPEDVARVLLLVDAALFLQHLQPLLPADLESCRHPVDLGVQLLRRSP